MWPMLAACAGRSCTRVVSREMAGRWRRNRRCGAKTRNGAPCRAAGIGRGRRCHNHGGMCTAPKSTATGADCNTYRYWLLLLSLGRTWCEIPRATRLCLFLARGESFGSTWRRLLVTWRQSGLTRCGAGFAFSCVLRGGWESKECSSNDDRYDALHCQLLLVVCASEGQECRTKTARM